MIDKRRKGVSWVVADEFGKSSLDEARLAVLMDIRDHIRDHGQLLLSLERIGNLTNRHLNLIRRQTKKRKYVRKQVT